MTTIPLNLLYSLLCGGCLAACAGARMAVRPRHRQPDLQRRQQRLDAADFFYWLRLLQAPLLYVVLAVMPAAAYLAAQFPDWSFMYLLDSQRLSAPAQVLWVLGAALLTGAAVVPGFILGLRGAQRYGGRTLGLALGGLLLGYLALALWAYRTGRLAEVGTYANFHADLGGDLHAGGWLMRPLFSLDAWRLGDRAFALLYDLIAINLCQAVALVLVGRALVTKSEFIVDRPISYWQS